MMSRLEILIAGMRANLIAGMRANQNNIRYADLVKLCNAYFGDPRTTSGSHAVYRTPWPGDPRVNIQNRNGNAKPYQVRQVLAAIEKMKEQDDGAEHGD